jgi:uncharacterized membrane protein
MRSFIRDRLSQSVIGVLVATFVFCVLLLRHIPADPAATAPRISMTTAILLAVSAVLLIMAYLNRLAHGLQVGEVVRTIAAEADSVVQEIARQASRETPATHVPSADPENRLVVSVLRDGWVTQSPGERILAAVPPSTVVRLETRTGAYIHRGEVLMTIWPAPPEPEKVRAKLLSTVEIADIRTMQQDIDFGIRQLVDIALRALSAAINDPTTATEVVLRLGSLIRTLLTSPEPPTSVSGPDGRVLLRPWDLSHDEYIAHAFGQIRQTGATQPHVVAALVRVLRMLIAHAQATGRAQLVPALHDQLRMLMESVSADRDLHRDDLARLRAIAEATTDPAEHDRRS